MNFAPGAIILDDIIGGTLQVGEVPNARLETDLTSLADALTVGGIVPHANLTEYLATLAPALTAAGIVPNANLTPRLRDFTNALTAGSKVPHANLTGELVTLATALMAGGKVPHANLTGELVTLANALLGGGKVPLQYIVRGMTYGVSTAQRTLLGGETLIKDFVLPNVLANDLVIAWGWVKAYKGIGAAGAVAAGVKRTAGTAAIYWTYDALHGIAFDTDNPAPQAWEKAFCAVGRVTTGGTLTLSLYGTSHGSSSVCEIGDGQLHTWVFPLS